MNTYNISHGYNLEKQIILYNPTKARVDFVFLDPGFFMVFKKDSILRILWFLFYFIFLWGAVV